MILSQHFLTKLDRLNTDRVKYFVHAAEWNPSHWMVAFMGELGEAMNEAKKVYRSTGWDNFLQVAQSEKKDILVPYLTEMSDCVIYLGLWLRSILKEMGVAYEWDFFVVANLVKFERDRLGIIPGFESWSIVIFEIMSTCDYIRRLRSAILRGDREAPCSTMMTCFVTLYSLLCSIYSEGAYEFEHMIAYKFNESSNKVNYPEMFTPEDLSHAI